MDSFGTLMNVRICLHELHIVNNVVYKKLLQLALSRVNIQDLIISYKLYFMLLMMMILQDNIVKNSIRTSENIEKKRSKNVTQDQMLFSYHPCT